VWSSQVAALRNRLGPRRAPVGVDSAE
jgi:hypothetical protein